MEPLLEALVRKRFGTLNEVQKKAWPVVASGANALVIAPTGFGKTEAALLPLLNSVMAEKNTPGVLLLYITPLRALNRDMLARIKWWCGELGLTVGVRHGDTGQAERTRQSETPPHLMITTPETFASMLVNRRLGPALENLRAIVIDEVHELFSDKRGAQLALSLERLVARRQRTGKEASPEIQRVGLSATVGNEAEVARFLAGDRLCEVVEVGRKRLMHLGVVRPHKKEEAELAEKLHVDSGALGRLEFLKQEIEKGKALVFVNTRQMAEILSSRLLKMGASVAVHHGSLSREARLAAEDAFREGKVKALLCTSSLELGIDIGDIERVVQYSSPRQVTRLVQRVGRSGHAEKLVPHGTVVATDGHDQLECGVIAERAEAGQLEKDAMVHAALDVLAQSAAGFLVERGSAKADEMHAVFRRAAPYASLKKEELVGVLEQLVAERLVKKEGETYVPGKAALLYYYKNVSTIPKAKKFAMRNAATNSIVASLDEAFVSMLGPGEVFISKGVPWRVLDVGEEIVVEPSDELGAGVPDWIGEEIPIPYDIAQAVGKKRAEIGKLAGNAPRGYEEDAAAFASVPASDKTIVVDACGENVVVHACFGTKANRTLGLALSTVLGAKYGVKVRADSDAYCIFLRTPLRAKAAEVAAVFNRLGSLKEIMEMQLGDASLFKYRFVHVARLFGLISEDMTVGQRAMKHLVGTPIHREAVRSALADYFDVEAAQQVLAQVRSGGIEVIAIDAGKLSQLSRMASVRVRAGEFLAPIEPTREVLKAFAAQLSSKSVRFLCTYCGRVFYEKAGDIRGKVRCGCGSTMVAAIDKEEEPKEMLKKEKPELLLRASIVEAYGKRAAIALSTYGVGSRTAARVLARLHKDDAYLFMDLLEAQKLFIRTKRYWSSR
jgi:ATP-dependent Lhr-like helicase